MIFFNLTICLLLIVIVYILFLNRKKIDSFSKLLQEKADQEYFNFIQYQSLINIKQMLEGNCTLPKFRDKWSIGADFGELILKQLLKNDPSVILDLGSGSSSIVMGLWLKKHKKDSVIYSVESNFEFIKIIQDQIDYYELNSIVKLIHAPLKEISVNDFKGKWYDLNIEEFKDNIDIMVVDGPPGHIQRLSRYPALPCLKERLSRKCIVLVDDVNRHEEIEIISRWKFEFSQFKFEYHNTETGAMIISK